MNIQLLSVIIIGLIAVYFIFVQKRKDDHYFSGPVKFTNKQLKTLIHYKSIYQPIPVPNKLATLAADGWELEDIAHSATEMIYDQPIPTATELASLVKGDRIKLNFADQEGYVERMWVEYTGQDGDFHKGLLRNDSFDHELLKEGKEVYFHFNHVLLIEGKKSKA